MFKSITFYNHFHNGDIHVSRGFVDYIAEKCNYPIFYAHKNSSEAYKNKKVNFIPLTIESTSTPPKIINDSLCINTWYASENYKFMKKNGLTFDTLYELFEEVCKNYLSIQMPENADELFPSIDYDLYPHTNNIKRFIENKKIVLICNGKALSGQSEYFDMNKIALSLANKYHGITFILTNKVDPIVKRENLYYSEDIIKKDSCDLNENAYISEHSMLIVGRSSGVFTFAMTRENLFKRSPTILSFSNLNYSEGNNFWIGNKFKNKIKYSAKIIEHPIMNPFNAEEKIEQALKDEIKKL